MAIISAVVVVAGREGGDDRHAGVALVGRNFKKKVKKLGVVEYWWYGMLHVEENVGAGPAVLNGRAHAGTRCIQWARRSARPRCARISTNRRASGDLRARAAWRERAASRYGVRYVVRFARTQRRCRCAPRRRAPTTRSRRSPRRARASRARARTPTRTLSPTARWAATAAAAGAA